MSKQTNIAVAVLVGVSICAISFAWDAGNDFKLSESMKLGFFSKGMGPERATPDLGRLTTCNVSLVISDAANVFDMGRTC